MTDPQSQLDQSIQRLVAAIDRESNLSATVQLRGALVFGIASGDLPAGTKLPSVRQLANWLAISPVTVSGVYAALQAAGHVEARVGAGTFVRDGGPRRPASQYRELDRRIADLIELGRLNGLSPADLALRLTHAPSYQSRGLTLVMLGNFETTTRSYAEALRPQLPTGDRIEAVTVDALDGGAPRPPADLVILPRTLQAQAERLFPGVPRYGISLIPDQATRMALASISPEAQVVAYSYFADFLISMKAGVLRFAPHVTRLSMVARGDVDAQQRFEAADVIVYSSGIEPQFTATLPGRQSFEYHHEPDSHAVRHELLPLIAQIRQQPPTLSQI